MKMTSTITRAALGCFMLAAAILPARAGDTEKADIVDTAIAAGQFNTLATALTKAELVDALRGDGPFTVFAPTDDAFAKLDQNVLGDLLKPENKEKLQAILLYHVVAGNVPASAVIGKVTKAETLQGSKIKVDGRDGVKVNNASVIQADVIASNGTIHVIDTVLLPPKKN